MTITVNFGRAINVAPSLANRYSRPAWLKPDEMVSPSDGSHPGAAAVFFWSAIDAFALPEGHWAYPVIEAGFTPWSGGDTAPHDVEKGDVMLRDGKIQRWYDCYLWEHDNPGWTNRNGEIIGYHRKGGEIWTLAPEIKVFGRSTDAPIAGIVQPPKSIDVDTVNACIALVNAMGIAADGDDYGLGYNSARNSAIEALQSLLPKPEPTIGEQLYNEYVGQVDQERGGHPPFVDANRTIAFANWIMQQTGRE